ncbi:hypothetical protein STENM36S_01727 [Streptomyces tendae]
MPAPTMARIAGQPAAAWPRCGRNPAASQGPRVMSDQGPLPPKIHGSAARSASRSRSARASGWSPGRATSSGSVSSGTRVKRGSTTLGACAASDRARSTSPAASSSYASCASASRTRTASPGRVVRRAVTAGTTRAGTAVEKAPTRTSPASPRMWAANSASARSSCSNTASACRSTSRAASVSRTLLPWAWSSSTPNCLARFVSCWETADGVMCSASAVAVTVPLSRRVRRICSLRMSQSAMAATYRRAPAPRTTPPRISAMQPACVQPVGSASSAQDSRATHTGWR